MRWKTLPDRPVGQHHRAQSYQHSFLLLIMQCQTYAGMPRLVHKSLMVCRGDIVESWWCRNVSGFRDRTLLSRDHRSCELQLVADFYSVVVRAVVLRVQLVSREYRQCRGNRGEIRNRAVGREKESERYHLDSHLTTCQHVYICTHVRLHRHKSVLSWGYNKIFHKSSEVMEYAVCLRVLCALVLSNTFINGKFYNTNKKS